MHKLPILSPTGNTQHLRSENQISSEPKNFSTLIDLSPQAQKIASNSRAGIVTTDKGNRSVLRSVGPNNTVPPEHLAGPDFVPENDIGFYTNSHAVDVVTRYEIGADASASRVSLKDISCRASLAISPGEMSMSSCEDGSWALGGGQEPQPQPDTEMDSEKTNTEELEMMTERIAESFKATSAWYRKLQAKEIKWQHVTVITQWNEAKKFLGVM